MNIRLFPDRFLKEDACFQLFRPRTDGALELPVTIEGKSGIPVHIVHSDPDNLACLAALLVVQSWLYGIDELELPPARRQPLLVITEQPGRLAEAYLRLHIPAAKIRELSKRRITALHQKLDIVKKVKEKCEFWWMHIKDDDQRSRLHNFFPAHYILRQDSPPHHIASREHVGRGDDSGPALLIVRATKRTHPAGLRDLFNPFLIIVDAHGLTVPDGETEPPRSSTTVPYSHRKSPVRQTALSSAACPMPDSSVSATKPPCVLLSHPNPQN